MVLMLLKKGKGCYEYHNPLFVLSVLRTNFYKSLMIQKSRGATPSRRRLSHEDFSELPFPKIDAFA